MYFILMKNRLKFKNPEIEKQYISHNNEQAIGPMRLGYWIAVILFAVFGVLDYFLMPFSYEKMWFIRFAVVIPVATAAYFMSFVKSFRRYMQAALSVGAVIMGMGIVAMMAVADVNDPGYRFYYAGIMLVIMGISSLFRLRFYYALSSSLIMIAGYEMMAIFIQRITDGGLSATGCLVFINNNFFFIGANIIGLFAAYYFENASRIEFVQQLEIIDRHNDISKLLSNMKTELELARQIQSRLLPESCPYTPNARFVSLYKPMDELAGDFYDFMRFKENNLTGVFISDVSGHGMPAALITSMLKTLGSTSDNMKLSGSGFLSYINMHLTGQIGDNFLTAIYGVYDSDTMRFTFSRAGHPFPVLIREGRIDLLDCSGGIIGIDPYMKFEDVTVQLEPGDRILLYTDGLTEEINDRKEMFEDIYFEKVLPSIAKMSIEDIVNLTYRRLIEHRGDENFGDDICIVGIEIF